MDTETQQFFSEQIGKLPSDVVSYLSTSSWSSDLDEIGSLYNLSQDELSSYKREVILVLLGVVHPDAFMDALKKEVGIKGAVLEALVLNVEKKIFVPIRPSLIKFFESEAGITTPQPDTVTPQITNEDVSLPETPMEGETFVLPETSVTPAPQSEIVRPWEKSPEIIPDNLPTEEDTEALLPNLIPKTIQPEPVTPTPETETGHPFEEKMKKVFTAGQQSMGEFAIEPVEPQTPKAPPIYHADPYREPIE